MTELRSERSDLVEIRTHPRCYGCPCYFKNKEDSNKNEGARVATTLNIDFSHSQGQITLQSRVESGLNSNSSEMLWLSLLLVSMKKFRSK